MDGMVFDGAWNGHGMGSLAGNNVLYSIEVYSTCHITNEWRRREQRGREVGHMVHIYRGESCFRYVCTSTYIQYRASERAFAGRFPRPRPAKDEMR